MNALERRKETIAATREMLLEYNTFQCNMYTALYAEVSGGDGPRHYQCKRGDRIFEQSASAQRESKHWIVHGLAFLLTLVKSVYGESEKPATEVAVHGRALGSRLLVNSKESACVKNRWPAINFRIRPLKKY